LIRFGKRSPAAPLIRIPLFQECNFSNVVEFHWAANRMLARDVSFLLHSNIDSLYMETPRLGVHGVSVVRQYVQDFVFGRAKQSKCEIHCRGMAVQYWCTWGAEKTNTAEWGAEKTNTAATVHGEP
uniref:DNA polymerase epsilon catalytic subunit n=1 Tax=Heligmosomoides polygyrus TaxID=6339 RepID=A0A183GCS9_HELPZ